MVAMRAGSIRSRDAFAFSQSNDRQTSSHTPARTDEPRLKAGKPPQPRQSLFPPAKGPSSGTAFGSHAARHLRANRGVPGAARNPREDKDRRKDSSAALRHKAHRVEPERRYRCYSSCLGLKGLRLRTTTRTQDANSAVSEPRVCCGASDRDHGLGWWRCCQSNRTLSLM